MGEHPTEREREEALLCVQSSSMVRKVFFTDTRRERLLSSPTAVRAPDEIDVQTEAQRRSMRAQSTEHPQNAVQVLLCGRSILRGKCSHALMLSCSHAATTPDAHPESDAPVLRLPWELQELQEPQELQELQCWGLQLVALPPTRAAPGRSRMQRQGEGKAARPPGHAPLSAQPHRPPGSQGREECPETQGTGSSNSPS